MGEMSAARDVAGKLMKFIDAMTRDASTGCFGCPAVCDCDRRECGKYLPQWFDAQVAALAATGGVSDDTRRLDALEKFATLRGIGFTNENGETELDEVHAFEIHEDTIVDAMPDHWNGGDLGDCSNLRDLADAILSAQPAAEQSAPAPVLPGETTDDAFIRAQRGG